MGTCRVRTCSDDGQPPFDVHLTKGKRLRNAQLRPLCAQHFQAHIDLVERSGFADEHGRHKLFFPDTLRPDEKLARRDWFTAYLQVSFILADTEFVDLAMRDFLDEVEHRFNAGMLSRDDKGPENLMLSRCLSTYEGLCWFGPQKKIMAGLLAEEEFFDAISRGFMVKDPGPGTRHGEFSHRLQWQAIMRVMTDSFSVPRTRVWEFSPLELFRGTVHQGRSRDIWTALFEGNGLLESSSHGDPNWVNRAFLEEGTLTRGRGDRYGRSPFTIALQARYTKRFEVVERLKEFALANLDWMELSGIHEGSNNRQHREHIKNASASVETALEHVYRWRKTRPPIEIQTIAAMGAIDRVDAWFAFEASETDVRAATATTDWETFPDVDKRLAFFFVVEDLHDGEAIDAGQNRYSGFDRGGATGPSHGMLLHGEDGVLIDVDLEERRYFSRMRLNPAYRYDKRLGALMADEGLRSRRGWRRRVG